MAERLGEALLDLRTDDKGFTRGVGQAERQAQGLGRQLDDTASRAAAMGKALAVAAAAGAAALGVLVKRAIDKADAMSKAAARTGVATEALSRLAWAGNLSDVSLGTLTGSLQRLSNVLSQVASGSAKDTKAIFDALGISVTDAEGRLRSADMVLADLADVFAAMEDGADKSALAIRIFGRSGAELIPLLNNGRKGLAEMAAEADRLGITISTEMGKRAEAFNDAMTRIRAAFEGIVIQLAEHVLPYLQEFADKLTDPQFVADAQAMARDVVEALGWIASSLKDLIGLFQDAKEWVDWLADKTPYGYFGLIRSGGEMLRGGARGTGPQPLGDDAFDTRFDPGLPGKTGRLPKAQPKGINITDLLGGSGGSGKVDAETRALEAKRKAVEDLIARLKDELAIVRESDPVQREMIALRETLAAATAEQTGEVRGLIAETLREREASLAAEEAIALRRDMVESLTSTFLRGISAGKNFWEALGDAAISALDRIVDKIPEVIGSLFELFSGGGGGGGGGIGNILGGLLGLGGKADPWAGMRPFSGFRAAGGLIPSGTFGIVGEQGPEPVIATSSGAMVLPNSSLAGLGGGGSGATVRLIMPEGWRAEILDEARSRAAGDTVEIVETYDKGRHNSWQNGADFA